MRCSCPKCKADIIEEFPEIPPEGIFLACPLCHANFNLKRESFARRALHKENEITCAECGDPPGHSIFCQNCHAIYPDFLVTESSSVAKKQLGKFFKLINAFRRLSVNLPKHATTTQSPQKQVAIKGIKLPGQPLQLAAALLVLVALLCGSGVYFYQAKIETDYINRYVKAIYIINSSEDYNNTLCDKIAADWKAKLTAGAPNVSALEQTFLARGLKDATVVMKKIDNPPKKFLASNQALTQLFEAYKQHQALTASPTGGAEGFAASSKTLSSEYRKSATLLKTGLPEKLSDRLTAAKAKYKELQTL